MPHYINWRIAPGMWVIKLLTACVPTSHFDQRECGAALRFYASGSFLQGIGDTLGLSKSAVSRIVTNVSSALARKQKDFIKWPTTEEEIARTKRGFYDKGGFPGVIGCVDSTHIRLQAPHENENDYVNRKDFHSINVQAISDHQGKPFSFFFLIVLTTI